MKVNAIVVNNLKSLNQIKNKTDKSLNYLKQQNFDVVSFSANKKIKNEKEEIEITNLSCTRGNEEDDNVFACECGNNSYFLKFYPNLKKTEILVLSKNEEQMVRFSAVANTHYKTTYSYSIYNKINQANPIESEKIVVSEKNFGCKHNKLLKEFLEEYKEITKNKAYKKEFGKNPIMRDINDNLDKAIRILANTHKEEKRQDKKSFLYSRDCAKQRVQEFNIAPVVIKMLEMANNK